MRIGIVTASMALALAAVACAQTTAPEKPVPQPRPSQPSQIPAQPQPNSPAASSVPGGTSPAASYPRSTSPRESALNAQERALAAQDEALAQQNLAVARRAAYDYRVLGGWSPSERPVVITTEPISAEIESEVKEDLTVMNKLLSDEAMRAGGDGMAPQAMGIKLSQLSNAEPTYIEGLGALFSYRVGLALAGSAAGGEKAKPAGPPSAWENAKRDLHEKRSLAGHWTKLKTGPPEMPPFDPAKVEELVNAIVRTLPEAKNIRHLKPDDVVMVTISGVDESGKAVRMTLKATKADIDQAAAGAMTPDAFAERVARRIG